jgi:predicted permease
LTWAPPISQGFGNSGKVSADGRPRSDEDRAWSNFVSPKYFETIDQRMVAGRDFTSRDNANSPRVAIVNQTMARHFFGSESPIGKRIDTSGETKFDCEIVGVVRDAIHFDLKERPQRVFYMPYSQGPAFLKDGNMMLAVRASLPDNQAMNQLRDAVLGVDRNVVAQVETLQTHIDGTFARERLLATLSGFLGGLSVLLVAMGLYGVMAWSVTRRTSEIGVRIALGAQPGSVMYMVLRESLVLVAIGTILGVSVALGLSRAVASLLFDVTPRDALAFGGAVAVMAVIATVATLLPAVRAARVDPLVALRYE